MAAQRQNIRLYAEQVDKKLQELEILKNQGVLGLYQTVALEEMIKANTHWQNAFQKARTIYESDDWRMDVPYYREQISPLLKKINNNLEALGTDLEQFANEDISELGHIARTLRSSVWGIGAVTVAITIFIYLLFVYSVERPLASIVRALKAEAEGEHEIELPQTDLQETRDLVDSFVYLRKQVHQRQKRLEAILENAGEAIVTIDEKGLIETFNDAAEELFEYRADEVIGRNISMLMPIPLRNAHDDYMKRYHDTGKANIIDKKREEKAMRKDGSLFPISLKVSEMELEGKRYYTGIIEDISEQKAILDHLKHMAQHDGLTGLYNRDYFQESLARAVEQVSRSPDAHYAMLYIDLDNFKFINDTMGHDAGDQLLIEVSSLLRKRTRRSDILARFGGDEFTVLLADVDIDKAEHIAESFRQQMAEYNFIHSGHNVDVACSIGVSTISQYSATPENVLSEADFACNLAKRNGRNQIHVFRENDRENVTSMSLDMSWSRRIKDALEQDRFVLALQPIVDLNTGQAVYSEVLLRMLDENGDIIMPGGFLPSAERFGLAKELDKWVIARSISTLAGINKDKPGTRFAINLSAQTLADLTVCDLIHKCLTDFDVDPAALTFEITETSAIADMNEAVSFISRLNMLGCRTALDDFGTGMSSFGYLRDLPVNMVKIDGRFIKQIAHNKVDQAMVSAMNEIAKALGLSTVAEFIEDQSCVDVLKRIGVDYGQGYYLGKPALVNSDRVATPASTLGSNVIPLG
jgi:diguanylate cyclase (GGDEF)-like protein/PAS domain S-box-containing protein